MVLGTAGASPSSGGWAHLNLRHPDFHCGRCRNLIQSREGEKKVSFFQPGVWPPLGGTPGMRCHWLQLLAIHRRRPSSPSLPASQGASDLSNYRGVTVEDAARRCKPLGDVSRFLLWPLSSDSARVTRGLLWFFYFSFYNTSPLCSYPPDYFVTLLFLPASGICFWMQRYDTIKGLSCCVGMRNILLPLSWNSCNFEISLCFDFHAFRALNACTIFGRSRRISL